MAIFMCVGYFYFHILEGICFAGFDNILNPALATSARQTFPFKFSINSMLLIQWIPDGKAAGA
jgi:hypothetical protein